MQLCFQNNYSSPVHIAVMWYNPGPCASEGCDWATAGWWNLAPGQSVSTNCYTNDRYYAFYAEADNGAVWAGNYGPVDCTDQAFESCQCIGSTADYLSLGMRLVDAGTASWSTFTVNLD
jgi:uncharacterized membrane protein